MGATTYLYDYIKSEDTYTLDQYIECQSDDNACYNNLSFIDEHDGIRFNTYNVLGDYIDEIRDCRTTKRRKEYII